MRDGMLNIKLVSVGGAGGNIADYIIKKNNSMDFMVFNTDLQDLNKSSVKTKLQLGPVCTSGLGAGADPNVGEAAANESKNEIIELLNDSDIICIVGGLGGGTASGAIPKIVEFVKSDDFIRSNNRNALVIVFVSTPFDFEGARRKKNCHESLEKILNFADSVIVTSNNKLFELPDKKITLTNAFAVGNEFTKSGIEGIIGLITSAGFINLDFADIKYVLQNSGLTLIGFGVSSGPDRSRKAVAQALSGGSLLERSIGNVNKILVNIAGSESLGLSEVNEIMSMVTQISKGEADVLFGTVVDENLDDQVKVTVFATGFAESDLQKFYNIEKDKDESINFYNKLETPSVFRRSK